MKKSESIKQLAAAMIIFSNKIDKISKTSVNPFFKSNYAALPEILEAIKTPLIESGLSIVQFPDENGLTSLLMHESGEWIEATSIMHPVKNDPQSIGSSITYSRRYSIGAILGLNIDVDDDGNEASKQPKTPENKYEDKPQLPWLNVGTPEFDKAKDFIAKGGDIKDIRKKYAISNKTLEALK